MAPQVSPDGKTLAYIRRVRLKSALYLRDLESGRDRELFGNVDKDLQEAWAVHGLYPQYAWTPDGRSIVIWGEGKIWRVDAASGKGAPIPFTARVEQTINEAVRFPQKVFADEFPVRMLRDVRVSPDGKLVVYSALGKLYVKALPDGQPRRLTKDGGFEFFPVVLARRAVDRLRDLDRRRDGARPRRAAGWRGGPRCGDAAGSLRRAVVLAGRPEDRVPPRRRRSDTRPVLRGRRRRLRRADRRRRAGAGARQRHRSGVRSHRHAHLRPRSPEREVHALERRRARAATRRCPAATKSSTSAATTPRSSRRRPTASGSRSRNGSGRSSRRSRAPAVRSTSARRRSRIRCSASRATPGSTCTGPATAGGCTGRSVRSSSRAISRTPLHSRRAPGAAARRRAR